MATRKQVIDGVLGDGWHDEFQQFETDIAYEKKRTALNNSHFAKFSGAVDGLGWDMRLLEEVGFDYRQAMKLIADGRSQNTTEIGKIHDVLTLAVDVVKLQNDALDGAFAMGITYEFVAMPIRILQHRAKNMQSALKKLKPLLEKAKNERKEAWFKLGVETALTALIIIGPPLGILARVGLGVAQWKFDDSMGPKTSSTVDALDKSCIVASHVVDEIGEIESLSKKGKGVAKVAGAGVAAVGIVFDVQEVWVGHSNVSDIRRAMSDANKAHTALLADIKRYKLSITRFVRTHERWKMTIKDATKNISELKYALQQEMKGAGYHPSH